MWPCIFGRYTNIIAAQIHLQCVSIKPSSQIKVTFSFQFQNYLFSTNLCRILWNKRITYTFMDSKYFLLYIFSSVKFWVSIDKDVLSTENVDHGNRLCQVCVWYSTAAGAWDREGWWLHCDSLPLTGPFRYLVIISNHQQRYHNHYLSPPSESSSPTSTW